MLFIIKAAIYCLCMIDIIQWCCLLSRLLSIVCVWLTSFSDVVYYQGCCLLSVYDWRYSVMLFIIKAAIYCLGMIDVVQWCCLLSRLLSVVWLWLMSLSDVVYYQGCYLLSGYDWRRSVKLFIIKAAIYCLCMIDIIQWCCLLSRLLSIAVYDWCHSVMLFIIEAAIYCLGMIDVVQWSCLLSRLLSIVCVWLTSFSDVVYYQGCCLLCGYDWCRSVKLFIIKAAICYLGMIDVIQWCCLLSRLLSVVWLWLMSFNEVVYYQGCYLLSVYDWRHSVMLFIIKAAVCCVVMIDVVQWSCLLSRLLSVIWVWLTSFSDVVYYQGCYLLSVYDWCRSVMLFIIKAAICCLGMIDVIQWCCLLSMLLSIVCVWLMSFSEVVCYQGCCLLCGYDWRRSVMLFIIKAAIYCLGMIDVIMWCCLLSRLLSVVWLWLTSFSDIVYYQGCYLLSGYDWRRSVKLFIIKAAIYCLCMIDVIQWCCLLSRLLSVVWLWLMSFSEVVCYQGCYLLSGYDWRHSVMLFIIKVAVCCVVMIDVVQWSCLLSRLLSVVWVWLTSFSDVVYYQGCCLLCGYDWCRSVKLFIIKAAICYLGMIDVIQWCCLLSRLLSVVWLWLMSFSEVVYYQGCYLLSGYDWRRSVMLFIIKAAIYCLCMIDVVQWCCLLSRLLSVVWVWLTSFSDVVYYQCCCLLSGYDWCRSVKLFIIKAAVCCLGIIVVITWCCLLSRLLSVVWVWLMSLCDVVYYQGYYLLSVYDWCRSVKLFVIKVAVCCVVMIDVVQWCCLLSRLLSIVWVWLTSLCDVVYYQGCCLLSGYDWRRPVMLFIVKTAVCCLVMIDVIKWCCLLPRLIASPKPLPECCLAWSMPLHSSTHSFLYLAGCQPKASTRMFIKCCIDPAHIGWNVAPWSIICISHHIDTWYFPV